MSLGFQALPKPPHGYVGIYNRGSTSAMNSLLQTLFHFISFRNAVYCAIDMEADVGEERPRSLVEQLKRLFVILQWSSAAAVVSTDLNHLLKESVREQHQQDAHEVFLDLLDTLSQGQSTSSAVKKLFQGRRTGLLRDQ